MIRYEFRTWTRLIACFLLTLCLQAADVTTLDQAYRSLNQGRPRESLALFQEYLREHPRDVAASLDCAGLLSQLHRHSEAAAILESLSQSFPANETIRFKWAIERSALQDFAGAEAMFEALTQSENTAMAEAARDALVQVDRDRERLRIRNEETAVYELVRELKTQEALAAIADLEAEGDLSRAMAMQRLYLLYNMGRFEEASRQAETLADESTSDTDLDLDFLRAELFMQLGMVDRAKAIWTDLQEHHPGTFAADEAARRLTAAQPAPQEREQEREVYRLAEEGRHQEVIRAVDQLEVEAESLPLSMEMQRLYALFNLGYFDIALAEAESLAPRFPGSVDLSLLRAEILVKLDQPAKAAALWEQIEAQVPDSAAALEARRRRTALIPPVTTSTKEQRIYDLAAENRPAEVVAAVAALEQEEGSISLAMQKQRLYALLAQGEYESALASAQPLADEYPDDADLAFILADALAGANRHEEAQEIWRGMAERHASTPIATEAERRLEESLTTPRASPQEVAVFALAQAKEHDRVVTLIDRLEAEGMTLSSALEMQRLYALIATDQTDRALQEADRIASNPEAKPEMILLYADLLTQAHRWEQASLWLRQLKRRHQGTSYVDEANRRLDGLPLVANLDRWHWGEAYAAGDYYGRFEALIGSGFVRFGTFIPNARWLQPHAEFKFVVDTESEISARPTIISDNHVGHYAGIRAQLFPREYIFLYAQAGVNRDLLDRRDEGDYAFDYQVGVYGFKSWGPGVTLRQAAPEDFQWGGGDDRSAVVQTNGFFWRGDWFTDASLNFSYYHRYATWLGYASAREGFRLFQVGPRVAFDSYLVQNLAWDVAGNYFDNLFEVGPGVRLLWTPCANAQVVLRTEWHYGTYLGRHPEQRGGAESSYDEIVAGLSVGMRW